MEENVKVDKDYIEAFNQGYTLSKELGLKPDIIEGLSAGNNRMQAMKDGMEQHQKEVSLEKDKRQDKDIIPPFDLDIISDRKSSLDKQEVQKQKEKGKDFDMEL